MNRIYLDHGATSPLRVEAREAMLRHLVEPQANPSSIHAPGHRARMTIETARERIARLLGATADEIVLTGGGSEANNLALFGRALSAGPGYRQVVTSGFEHPSVLAVMEDLAARGFEVVRVAPGRDGIVRSAHLLEAVTPATCLVSLMLANNEVGTLQPVGELAGILRERRILLHSDAAQAVGKVPVDVRTLGVDLMTVAAHKFGGPQGAGALYVRQGVRLHPHLRGGGQELNRRPGTENVAAIAGFGAAAEAAARGMSEEAARVAALRDRLEERMRREIPGLRVNGADAPRVPGVSSVAIDGATGEGLVIALDLEGVAVSAGAACSAGTIRRSATLAAMGLHDEAGRSIRVSLGPQTGPEEIDEFIRRLKDVVTLMRGASSSRQLQAVS